jgi:hypothetical protein
MCFFDLRFLVTPLVSSNLLGTVYQLRTLYPVYSQETQCCRRQTAPKSCANFDITRTFSGLLKIEIASCIFIAYCLMDRYCRDHMAVGFTTTCVISVYHHQSCESESHSLRGVLDTTLCDNFFL